MIPFNKPTIREAEIKETLYCLISDHLKQGSLLDDFNKALENHLKVKKMHTVFSSETAFLLSLYVLGVKAGDEVVLSRYTPVSFVKALMIKEINPVFVDIQAETGLMDSSRLKDFITDRTRAIFIHIPFFIDSENLNDFSGFNLPFIYDISSLFMSTKLLQILDSLKLSESIFLNSFFENNIITTGGSGCSVFSYHKEITKKLSSLLNNTQELQKDFNLSIDLSISNLQASMGLVQLEKINELKNTRQKIAFSYHSILKDKSCFSYNEDNPYLYYPFVCKPFSKEELKKIFLDNGVELNDPFFYGKLDEDKSIFKATASFTEHTLCLPLYPTLTHEEVLKITNILSRLF